VADPGDLDREEGRIRPGLSQLGVGRQVEAARPVHRNLTEGKAVLPKKVFRLVEAALAQAGRGGQPLHRRLAHRDEGVEVGVAEEAFPPKGMGDPQKLRVDLTACPPR
ncbi:MAG: hypothetical protein QGH70_12865, partial [Nitrospinota bacterium]|nr:hypothetical protein [Nitrospinota bacterium]